MAALLNGARLATQEDSQLAYENFSEISKKYGYTVGITGSTVYGDGADIDLLVVGSVDANESASRVAHEFTSLGNAEHIYYYEEDEDGSKVAAVFLQHDKTVLDCYFIGLKFSEVEDRP